MGTVSSSAFCREAMGPRETQAASQAAPVRKEVSNILSASSQARPAPNPRPTHAGQALRLNKSTEKTTPNERPSEDLMIMEEMARSH